MRSPLPVQSRSPRWWRIAPLLIGLGGAAAGIDTAPATRPAAPAVPAYRQADHVAVLTVHGPIDALTLRSLVRRTEEARRDGADAIVLDIDTPGGELTATLDICNLLKDRNETPANMVAWIHPQAYSAGTIIALACREIVVASNASFGDAAPISPFGPIPTTERAKIESPILAEVIDSARRNHYDENLVQAFIGVGVELWLVEHRQTTERAFLTAPEYDRVFGETPPQVQTPVAPATNGSGPGQVRPWFSDFLPELPEGEGMSEDALRAEIEFQQQLPSTRTALTEADRDDWRLVTQVASADRLLTVKPAEAIYYGLAQTTIDSDAQLETYFGARRLTRYDQSWSESLVRTLVSWPVRIVLIVIFLVGLFVELAAPGLGVFGATAGVALLMLVGAPYLTGLAQWWEIVLIVAGLVLVAAELFVIPGFGVAGVTGVACLFAGIVGTFVSGDIRTPQGQDEAWIGVTTILTALFMAVVVIWIISRQFQSLPLLRRFVLSAEVSEAPAGVTSVGMLEAMAGRTQGLAAGDVGVARTDLRPAGRAEFEGRVLDVKSVAPYIEKGMPVCVVSVDQFVIEVEEVDFMSLMLAQDAAANDAYLLWAFLLLAAAIVLAAVELLVPSGGLIALLCGVAMVGSVIAFFKYDTMWGVVAAAMYVILTPIVVIFVFKMWLNSPLGRRMILGGETGAINETRDEAYAASEQARMDRLAELTALIGAEGTAVTHLRPVGTVKIGDRRIDALAETGVIDAGTRVIVTDAYDNQIKVREA